MREPARQESGPRGTLRREAIEGDDETRRRDPRDEEAEVDDPPRNHLRKCDERRQPEGRNGDAIPPSHCEATCHRRRSSDRIRRASAARAWSWPIRCSSPWISRRAASSSRLRRARRACRAATSTPITTSPSSEPRSAANSPSTSENERTSVGATLAAVRRVERGDAVVVGERHRQLGVAEIAAHAAHGRRAAGEVGDRPGALPAGDGGRRLAPSLRLGVGPGLWAALTPRGVRDRRRAGWTTPEGDGRRRPR